MMSLGGVKIAYASWQDVYSRRLEFSGEEHVHTISAAINYALMLTDLERFAEAKSLFRKMIPVAQRVLGASHDLTLRMKWAYATALHKDPAATRDDLREAVTTLEDAERIARRVLGGAHPVTTGIEVNLREARAALRARESAAMAAGGRKQVKQARTLLSPSTAPRRRVLALLLREGKASL